MDERRILAEPSANSGSANGYRLQAPQTLQKTTGEDGQSRPRRSFAILAGWMTIIAGLLAFFNGLMALLGQTSSNLFDIVIDLNRYSMCATMIMALGVVAIVGGISAIRGKNISLALVGAALGMMGGGIVGFWLGITAILFLFLSNEDL